MDNTSAQSHTSAQESRWTFTQPHEIVTVLQALSGWTTRRQNRLDLFDQIGSDPGLWPVVFAHPQDIEGDTPVGTVAHDFNVTGRTGHRYFHDMDSLHVGLFIDEQMNLICPALCDHTDVSHLSPEVCVWLRESHVVKNCAAIVRDLDDNSMTVSAQPGGGGWRLMRIYNEATDSESNSEADDASEADD